MCQIRVISILLIAHGSAKGGRCLFYYLSYFFFSADKTAILDAKSRGQMLTSSDMQQTEKNKAGWEGEYVTYLCSVHESSWQLHSTKTFNLVLFKILQQFLKRTKLIPYFLQFSFQNSFSKSDTGMEM